jgi:hypothetical protein
VPHSSSRIQFVIRPLGWFLVGAIITVVVAVYPTQIPSGAWGSYTVTRISSTPWPQKAENYAGLADGTEYHWRLDEVLILQQDHPQTAARQIMRIVRAGWPMRAMGGWSNDNPPFFTGTFGRGLVKFDSPWIGTTHIALIPQWPGFYVDAFLYGAACWLAWFLLGRVRRRDRISRSECPQCGYSRAGLQGRVPCPECGSVFTQE